ncbi:MAG TPA: lipopolysaccharide biosynthesis protein [Vicinamibacterales bacterium]|nr:lipopolysaccharide biosynthesis protein [Vicinamibacterales bacterium]
MFSKIRALSRDVTVYGLGDVAVSIVNFCLLGLYVKYLDAADYGVIGMLGSVEVAAKIAFRFGLDGAFMRLFYESERPADRQRLASTIFFFLLALNGAVVSLLLLAAPALASALLGGAEHTAALRLMLLNTFAIGFTFIPFHVLRIEQRTVTFSLLTLARAGLTTIVRLVLVVALGMGVTGLYLADVLVTVILMGALARWFVPLIRPVFSRAALRDALRFGLPRVPHAAAQQVMAIGDRLVLKLFVPIESIGIYSMAVSFGLVQKLFLSAFESAWAPFYYATVREGDAPRTFRTITTYGVAVLALLTAGLSAVGRHAAQAMTHGFLLAPDDPRWRDVETVITWTAIGVFLQGFYLLTSIGLNITKRTEYYPAATLSAAAVNIVLNFALIPRFGIVGAAWANGAGYAVQAAVGYVFSQRFYPIEYEWGRLIRVCAAAGAATLAARLLPAITLPVSARSILAPVPDLLARGVTVVVVFVALLALTGFFHAAELRRLAQLRSRGAGRRPPPAPPDSTEMAGEIVATDIGVPD